MIVLPKPLNLVSKKWVPATPFLNDVIFYVPFATENNNMRSFDYNQLIEVTVQFAAIIIVQKIKRQNQIYV